MYNVPNISYNSYKNQLIDFKNKNWIKYSRKFE